MKSLSLVGLILIVLSISNEAAQAQSNVEYFPPETISYSRQAHYSKFLASMNESSLYQSKSKLREAYRFLWLRAFDHPVVIRVWREARSYQLNVKVLDGSPYDESGEFPVKIKLDRCRVLTLREWEGVLVKLNETNYWDLLSPEERQTVEDGSIWVLEGVKDNRYHVVERAYPDNYNYRAACLHLLELSKLPLEADKIY